MEDKDIDYMWVYTNVCTPSFWKIFHYILIKETLGGLMLHSSFQKRKDCYSRKWLGLLYMYHYYPGLVVNSGQAFFDELFIY